MVERVELSGRLSTLEGDHVLVSKSASRIRDALNRVSAGSTLVREVGMLRAVDVDRSVFELRQRPDSKPNISCEVAAELLPDALDFLIRNVYVAVEGIQQFNRMGNA